MQLPEFCLQMGYQQETQTLLESIWEPVQSEFNPENPFPVSLQSILKFFPCTRLPEKYLGDLKEVCRILQTNEAAKRWAFLLHFGFFRAKPQFSKLTALPPPEKIFGDLAGMAQFAVALSAYPLIGETYRKLNVPEACLFDLPQNLGASLDLYARAHHGQPGYSLRQMQWMNLYIQGNMFRIGRLEYLIHPCPDWVPAVYRNKRNKRILLLCRDRWTFNADKQRISGDTPSPGGFITRLFEKDNHINGVPIDPRGNVFSSQTIKLDLKTWNPLLSPWDMVPSIHIPPGGGLTPALAKESLLMARDFFRNVFMQDIRLFACCSWILNPDWEKMLPDSNMADFIRQSYAAPPLPGDQKAGLFFVFGKDSGDFHNYPADTSLEKAFHQILDSGQLLRSGIALFPAEHLELYGNQYYREQNMQRIFNRLKKQ